MSLATWNIRGVNHPSKQRAVSRFLSEYKVDFLSLVETKVRKVSFSSTCSSISTTMKFHGNYHTSDMHGLYCSGIVHNVQLINSAEQVVTVKLVINSSGYVNLTVSLFTDC